MEDKLGDGVGRYWVLFLQPLPEAGERIAVALVFSNKRGRSNIEYDPNFSKAARIYPDLDRKGLEFYLDSMSKELESASQIESVLNAYGPQLSASNPRKINVPVASETVKMLLNRYIYPAKKPEAKKLALPPGRAAKEIEAYVRNAIGASVNLRTGLSAEEIVGRPISGTKNVALAIQGLSGWTLVDGVDLNSCSPAVVTTRADEISRTYWNYGRAASASGIQIKRVGIVLNGSSHLSMKTHDAHDYALHRFQVESDLAIDSASNESGALLRKLIAEV